MWLPLGAVQVSCDHLSGRGGSSKWSHLIIGGEGGVTQMITLDHGLRGGGVTPHHTKKYPQCSTKYHRYTPKYPWNTPMYPHHTSKYLWHTPKYPIIPQSIIPQVSRDKFEGGGYPNDHTWSSGSMPSISMDLISSFELRYRTTCAPVHSTLIFSFILELKNNWIKIGHYV